MKKVFEQYYETARVLIQKQDASLACFIDENNVEEILIDHDNWNGGIDYYRVIVKISIDLFGNFQQNKLLEAKERLVCEILNNAFRGKDEIVVSEVKLQPYATPKLSQISNLDISMWKPGCFRLFISHLTTVKDKAAKLKKYLQPLGIDAFVAHEDIIPTRKWQDVIENALFSMDALCAIITPMFVNSKWCDQEIGIAMGQRKCIIPIHKGEMPYGFLGSYQALSGDNQTNKSMAEAVAHTIYSNPLTRPVYLEKLINLLLNTKDKDSGMILLDTIMDFTGIENKYIETLHTHFAENPILLKSDFLRKGNVLFETYGLEKINKELMKTEDDFGVDLPF